MSKRRHAVTRRKPAAAAAAPVPPRRTETANVQSSWWLPALGAALLVVIGSLFLFTFLMPTGSALAPAPRRPALPEPWKVRSAEDRVIDEFVRRHRDGDPKAVDLLGTAPVFGDEMVSEAEAERRETDHFLRSSLEIVDIWRGEPTGQGPQKPVPGLYTLVARGGVFAPALQVDYGDGKPSPRQRTMHNPDLIVEVRDGKVRGVRSDVHTGPDR
jgi:hypothetical protein